MSQWVSQWITESNNSSARKWISSWTTKSMNERFSQWSEPLPNHQTANNEKSLSHYKNLHRISIMFESKCPLRSDRQRGVWDQREALTLSPSRWACQWWCLGRTSESPGAWWDTWAESAGSRKSSAPGVPCSQEQLPHSHHPLLQRETTTQDKFATVNDGVKIK